MVAFHSDSDFLNQGIVDEQLEIWLWKEFENSISFPLVLRQYP
jgi:hypothetical protein